MNGEQKKTEKDGGPKGRKSKASKGRGPPPRFRYAMLLDCSTLVRSNLSMTIYFSATSRAISTIT